MLQTNKQKKQQQKFDPYIDGNTLLSCAVLGTLLLFVLFLICSNSQTLACTYAALMLNDAGAAPTAENIAAAVAAAGVEVRPTLPIIFARFLQKKSVGDLIAAAASVAPTATASAAPAGGAAAAPAAGGKKEDKKKQDLIFVFDFSLSRAMRGIQYGVVRPVDAYAHGSPLAALTGTFNHSTSLSLYLFISLSLCLQAVYHYLRVTSSYSCEPSLHSSLSFCRGEVSLPLSLQYRYHFTGAYPYRAITIPLRQKKQQHKTRALSASLLPQRSKRTTTTTNFNYIFIIVTDIILLYIYILLNLLHFSHPRQWNRSTSDPLAPLPERRAAVTSPQPPFGSFTSGGRERAATPWSLSQQRVRAVTHYALLVRVLGKKCGILEHLLRDAVEAFEREQEMNQRDLEQRLRSAGASFDAAVAGPPHSGSTSVPGTAAPATGPGSPGPARIDPTLLPPGLEEEDYREEICFLDAVAMRDVSSPGEVTNTSLAAAPPGSAFAGHLWQVGGDADTARQRSRWLVSLFAKLNTEALPMATLERRCGPNSELRQLLRDAQAVAASPLPGTAARRALRGLETPSAALVGSFGSPCAILSSAALGASAASSHSPPALDPPLASSLGVNPMLCFSESSLALQGQSAAPWGDSFGGSSAPVPIASPVSQAGHSFVGSLPSCTTPLAEGLGTARTGRHAFSLRVFFASLRWNIAALLWADGQVEECSRWLASIPVEGLLERLREDDKEAQEADRLQAVASEARANFLHSHTPEGPLFGSPISRDTTQLFTHGGSGASPALDPAVQLSWRALLRDATAAPCRSDPLGDLFISPGRRESHTQRLVQRAAAMRDVCRLVLSAGETFLDLLALLHHVDNALRRQEEYLSWQQATEHRQTRSDSDALMSDAVARVLTLLHTTVEFALATRARHLFRHRLIRDGTYNTMLQLARRTAGGAAETAPPFSPVSRRPDAYVRGLEEDAVCSACSELIRLVTRKRCQSIFELRDVGLPSASYIPHVPHATAPRQSPTSGLIDPRLPYVLAVNVLQVCLHFASSYRTSRVFQGVAAREEIGFHTLLSAFLVELERAPLPAGFLGPRRSRQGSPSPSAPASLTSSTTAPPPATDPYAAAAATATAAMSPPVLATGGGGGGALPNTSAAAAALARGETDQRAAGLRKEPLQDPDGWRRRPLRLSPSPTATPAPDTSKGDDAGVFGRLRSAVSALVGGVAPPHSWYPPATTSQGQGAQNRAVAPPSASMTDQLLYAYKLYMRRYRISSSDKGNGSGSPSAFTPLRPPSEAPGRGTPIRHRRWVSPPPTDDSDDSEGSDSPSPRAARLQQSATRCARQALGLGFGLGAGAGQQGRSRDRERQPEPEPDGVGPPQPRVVCLWLPSRGAVPLLPELASDETEEREWESWDRSPSGGEGQHQVPSPPAPDGTGVTAASTRDRRSLSLRLLTLLSHAMRLEESVGGAAHDVGATRRGGLEAVPLASLRVVAGELNKAVYLLPQRIRRLRGGGETWWEQWVVVHRRHVRRFYARALKDVFVLEEAERVAAQRQPLPLPDTAALPPLSDAADSPALEAPPLPALQAALGEDCRVEDDGELHGDGVAVPVRRVVLTEPGSGGGAGHVPLGLHHDTSSHMLVHGPAAAEGSTFLSVLWDLPPFFLPEVRLDMSAFTTATIETQESMRRAAENLSRLQRERDERYRQQCLAGSSQGATLLDTVCATGQTQPQELEDSSAPALCVLDGPARHVLHDALPFLSQFLNWRMIYNSSTHGLSLQTLYQCCSAEAGARSRGSSGPSVHGNVPMLLFIEVMPSFTCSFERDGEGVRDAAAWARDRDREREGLAPVLTEGELAAKGYQRTPNRLVIGAYLSDMLLCDTRRYYGSSDCFVFQVMLPGLGRPEVGAASPAQPAPQLRLFRSSAQNTQFINCRRTSVMVGGGSVGNHESTAGGSAVYIDASMVHGATAACPTFRSPPLTEFRVETDAAPHRPANGVTRTQELKEEMIHLIKIQTSLPPYRIINTGTRLGFMGGKNRRFDIRPKPRKSSRIRRAHRLKHKHKPNAQRPTPPSATFQPQAPYRCTVPLNGQAALYDNTFYRENIKGTQKPTQPTTRSGAQLVLSIQLFVSSRSHPPHPPQPKPVERISDVLHSLTRNFRTSRGLCGVSGSAPRPVPPLLLLLYFHRYEKPTPNRERGDGPELPPTVSLFVALKLLVAPHASSRLVSPLSQRSPDPCRFRLCIRLRLHIGISILYRVSSLRALVLSRRLPRDSRAEVAPAFSSLVIILGWLLFILHQPTAIAHFFLLYRFIIIIIIIILILIPGNKQYILDKKIYEHTQPKPTSADVTETLEASGRREKNFKRQKQGFFALHYSYILTPAPGPPIPGRTTPISPHFILSFQRSFPGSRRRFILSFSLFGLVIYIYIYIYIYIRCSVTSTRFEKADPTYYKLSTHSFSFPFDCSRPFSLPRQSTEERGVIAVFDLCSSQTRSFSPFSSFFSAFPEIFSILSSIFFFNGVQSVILGGQNPSVLRPAVNSCRRAKIQSILLAPPSPPRTAHISDRPNRADESRLLCCLRQLLLLAEHFIYTVVARTAAFLEFFFIDLFFLYLRFYKHFTFLYRYLIFILFYFFCLIVYIHHLLVWLFVEQLGQREQAEERGDGTDHPLDPSTRAPLPGPSSAEKIQRGTATHQSRDFLPSHRPSIMQPSAPALASVPDSQNGGARTGQELRGPATTRRAPAGSAQGPGPSTRRTKRRNRHHKRATRTPPRQLSRRHTDADAESEAIRNFFSSPTGVYSSASAPDTPARWGQNPHQPATGSREDFPLGPRQWGRSACASSYHLSGAGGLTATYGSSPASDFRAGFSPLSGAFAPPTDPVDELGPSPPAQWGRHRRDRSIGRPTGQRRPAMADDSYLWSCSSDTHFIVDVLPPPLHGVGATDEEEPPVIKMSSAAAPVRTGGSTSRNARTIPYVRSLQDPSAWASSSSTHPDDEDEDDDEDDDEALALLCSAWGEVPQHRPRLFRPGRSPSPSRSSSPMPVDPTLGTPAVRPGQGREADRGFGSPCLPLELWTPSTSVSRTTTPARWASHSRTPAPSPGRVSEADLRSQVLRSIQQRRGGSEDSPWPKAPAAACGPARETPKRSPGESEAATTPLYQQPGQETAWLELLLQLRGRENDDPNEADDDLLPIPTPTHRLQGPAHLLSTLSHAPDDEDGTRHLNRKDLLSLKVQRELRKGAARWQEQLEASLTGPGGTHYSGPPTRSTLGMSREDHSLKLTHPYIHDYQHQHQYQHLNVYQPPCDSVSPHLGRLSASTYMGSCAAHARSVGQLGPSVYSSGKCTSTTLSFASSLEFAY
eukprot:gene8580-6020_t